MSTDSSLYNNYLVDFPCALSDAFSVTEILMEGLIPYVRQGRGGEERNRHGDNFNSLARN